MRGKGVEIIDSINKQGQLQGFKIKHLESGLDFKASEIKRLWNERFGIEPG